MIIKFYKYDGNDNVLDKTLGEALEITGTCRSEMNVLNPVIEITKNDISEYNYCHIEEFNRYYFIRKMSYVRNEIYRIEMTVDVLMSFKDDILNATGLIKQSENFDPYNAKNDLNYKNTINAKSYTFNNPFNETGNIVLIGI